MLQNCAASACGVCVRVQHLFLELYNILWAPLCAEIHGGITVFVYSVQDVPLFHFITQKNKCTLTFCSQAQFKYLLFFFFQICCVKAFMFSTYYQSFDIAW